MIYQIHAIASVKGNRIYRHTVCLYIIANNVEKIN
jgi:hypothetical protein